MQLVVMSAHKYKALARTVHSALVAVPYERADDTTNNVPDFRPRQK